jgi:hypothetical protein
MAVVGRADINLSSIRLLPISRWGCIISAFQETEMSRVVNTNAPGKKRSRYRRTIAELLRRLSRHQAIDQEAKDMAAALIYCLRGIDESVMQSVQAWERRNYWTKADRFMREWEWAGLLAAELEELVRRDHWSQLPDVMARLMPHFLDIELKKMTRSPSSWRGAHRDLLAGVRRT